MLLADTGGRTPAHRAAMIGNLSQLPPKLLNTRVLLAKDANGVTPLHLAAGDTARYIVTAGNIGEIPIHLLTEENLLMADVDGETVMHCAARAGNLHLLPAALLNSNTLLIADGNGCTPLHDAAEMGELNCLPPYILTEENLLISAGQITPLEHAREFEHLDALLGIELSERCRKIVGDEWFELNLEVIRTRQVTLERDNDAAEVELF